MIRASRVLLPRDGHFIQWMKEKARIEDALHAPRGAVEQGIVPGGGVALIRAQAVLDRKAAFRPTVA